MVISSCCDEKEYYVVMILYCMLCSCVHLQSDTVWLCRMASYGSSLVLYKLVTVFFKTIEMHDEGRARLCQCSNAVSPRGLCEHSK